MSETIPHIWILRLHYTTAFRGAGEKAIVAAMAIEAHETRHWVRGFDCGYGGPFKALSLADYFQEAAGDHARVLGVGMEAMKAAGRTWMLSRLDIGIKGLPSAGDEVIVRTWPAGTSRLFAQRCLELRSADGLLLAGALYEYLVVDIEARRPLRPEKILDPGLKGDYPPPLDDLEPGLSGDPGFSPLDLGAFEPGLSLSAAPRHLDYNGHVNNAHIIDWLVDSVPPERRGSGRLSRLKVDFIAELRSKDRVDSWVRHAEGPSPGWRILLTREGEPVARALAAWLP